MDKDKKLVVPEVNGDVLNKEDMIIANPNCSTIQMVVALKPLHDYAKIKRVVVSTYQAISGAGSEAIDEMKHQVKGDMAVKKLAYQILHNLIPQIDVAASTENDGITSTVKVQGPANDPLVSFSSSPELPQEEVLPFCDSHLYPALFWRRHDYTRYSP
jgi:aspartate-semialdehyde dehydrogenase